VLTEFHVGIDDTDSELGGCTTYTAALIFEELVERELAPSDFPWLVRLNPNIPWKTRGNGALAIHLRIEEDQFETVKQLVLRIIEKTSDPSIPLTDPAAVFLVGKIPGLLGEFSWKALHDVIPVQEATQLARRVKAELHTFGSCLGAIGALAAIGYSDRADGEYTYEIIAYRSKINLGKPRLVNLDSVRGLDARHPSKTFNTVDPETGRVLICPHGPDPVLLGIRGEHPLRLLEALREVEIHEPVERVMLFKTNQGTDAHLGRESSIAQVRPYQSVAVTGVVETSPVIHRGGHVIVKLRDPTGPIDCAAYRQTGHFRDMVLQLKPGDIIRAFGGIRTGTSSLTLNLEKFQILQLIADERLVKPSCPQCGSSCESMGRGQGFRCRKCRLRFPLGSATTRVTSRNLSRNSYIPPPRANRHLTKPASRLSRSKAKLEEVDFRGTDSPSEPNYPSYFVRLLQKQVHSRTLNLSDKPPPLGNRPELWGT
jgi:tRNA(Ile2)-agmatinylcytidine synthase